MHIIHTILQTKFSWYRRWHYHPLHPHAHWGIAGAVVLGVALSILQLGWFGFDEDGLAVGVQTVRAQAGAWVDFADVRGAGVNANQDEYGHGATFADLNNDGWLDIVEVRKDCRNFLYLSNQNGTFREAGGSAGINMPAEPMPCVPDSAGIQRDRKGIRSATAADIDNDGDIDLFMAAGGTIQNDYLYVNSFAQTGNLSFDERAVSAGVDNGGNGNIGVWADYDRDGLLDLFVANWEGTSAAADNAHALYHNDGDARFTNVTQAAGLGNEGSSQTAFWFDYNNDGWMDIFESRATQQPDAGQGNNFPHRLWRNNGHGSFDSIPFPAPGQEINTSPSGQKGLGAIALDYDNDGWLDIFLVSDSAPASLFRNNGDGTFYDTASGAGVANVSECCLPFPRPADVAAGDFNNDGWLDLYVGNYYTNSRIYFNNRNGTFSEHSSGLVHYTSGVSCGGDRAAAAALGDYDRDGFIDIYQVNSCTDSHLYRNQGNGNHWLQLDLRSGNRNAIGARASVTANGMRRVQEVNGGRSLNSQDSPILTFGLGGSSRADNVEIRWPSGRTERLSNVAADQRLHVREGGGSGGDGGGAGGGGGTPTPSDLNHDGLVNVIDLGILFSAWGGASSPADLNQNGAVDVADFGILLSQWSITVLP